MLVIATLLVTAAAATAQAPAIADPLAAVVPIGEHPTAISVLPAESSLIGIIEAFEEAARRLVLQTKGERVTFVLAADAVIRLGSRTLTAAELEAHRGRRAKVRFTQSGTRRTAHWIVIASERN
ncbi:MAG: hypothetical protein DMF84_27280 [Acidobacteria bacterium]|nr:MAG: hypothetical protein DMF84_27280 [Acidobacteriota bacterium]